MIRYMPNYRHRWKFRASYIRWLQIPAKTRWRKCTKEEWFDTDTEASDGEKKLSEEMIYPETGYAKTEGDINFLRLIRKLPKDQREVVYLKYAQELSFREIAEILGIPARTVRVKSQDCIKEIKKKGGKAGCITDREERKKRIYIKH